MIDLSEIIEVRECGRQYCNQLLAYTDDPAYMPPFKLLAIANTSWEQQRRSPHPWRRRDLRPARDQVRCGPAPRLARLPHVRVSRAPALLLDMIERRGATSGTFEEIEEAPPGSPQPIDNETGA